VASLLPFAVFLLTPPLLVVALLFVLAGTVAPTLWSRDGQAHSSQADLDGTSDRTGRVVVMAAGGVGGLSVLVAAGQILAL
jgi:hypothetical protein